MQWKNRNVDRCGVLRCGEPKLIKQQIQVFIARKNLFLWANIAASQKETETSHRLGKSEDENLKYFENLTSSN